MFLQSLQGTLHSYHFSVQECTLPKSFQKGILQPMKSKFDSFGEEIKFCKFSPALAKSLEAQ